MESFEKAKYWVEFITLNYPDAFITLAGDGLESSRAVPTQVSAICCEHSGATGLTLEFSLRKLMLSKAGFRSWK
jgi:hypothetical protein